MTAALIGHTGFVGSNLARAGHFDSTFNSTNIATIRGRSFDRVVCAGVTAVKWWANQNAAEDRRRIEALMADLDTIQAKVFTLISTVDVYGDATAVDEATPPATAGLHAYGQNRAALEDFVRRRFPLHHIVRLPGLFGAGLKKNAIFDLMTDNRLDHINPASKFQWYPLDRLPADLLHVEASGLDLVNLVTEPVEMEFIRASFFPTKALSGTSPAVAYDIRTAHAEAFGGSFGYILREADLVGAFRRFLAGAGP